MEDDLSGLRGNKYFSKAFNLAKHHPFYNEVASIHAAVLVKGNKIIASGINRPGQTKLVRRFSHHGNCNIHAEISVLNKPKSDLKGTKMYVARIGKQTKKPAMSKPCAMCEKAIKNFGIKKVYYTTENGFKLMRI